MRIARGRGIGVVLGFALCAFAPSVADADGEPRGAGVDAVREAAASNPLVALATAWRDARTIAAYGTLPPASSPASSPSPGAKTAKYALVCLVSATEPGAAVATDEDPRTFTREAFAARWAEVEAGGLLAWFAADEAVFARGMLQAAEVVASDRGPGAWSRDAMAFRLPSASASRPRWALLISRGGLEPETSARIAAVERTLPVQALFGPGVAARGVWTEAAALPVDAARDALRRDLSRRAGHWLDLAPATRQRPAFFHLDALAPAALRASAGVAVAALLAALLLPLPRRRRAGSADAPPWPLPMLLVAPSAPVAGAVSGVIAFGLASHGFGGEGAWIAAACILAAAAGALAARGNRDSTATRLALAGVATVAAGAFAVPPALGAMPSGASVVPAIAPVPGAFVLGYVGVAAFRRGRAALLQALPEARGPLAWVAATGVATAIAGAAWLAYWRGTPAVWIASAACFAIGAMDPAGAPRRDAPVRAGSG